MLSKIFLSSLTLPDLVETKTDIRLLKTLVWLKFDTLSQNQVWCRVIRLITFESERESLLHSQFAWVIASSQKVWGSLTSNSKAELVLTRLWFRHSDISFCSDV